MKSMSALKEEIDSLLPRERQELLKYIISCVTTDRSQNTADAFLTDGAWADEGGSDAQYVIPELNYRRSNVGQETQQKSEDDLP
jgi:hypothetical protein